MQEQQEKIIHLAKQSRRGILLSYIIIVALIIISIYIIIKMPSIKILSYALAIIAIILLIISELKIKQKKIILSDKRAILEVGIAAKQFTTIKYSSITEVILKQSLIERILNYGTLHIRTSGTKKEHDLVIENVSTPVKVKAIIEKYMIHHTH